MQIIKPHVEIVDKPLYQKIEYAGRVCYKSEEKITDDSFEQFIKNIINCGHESVLEHGRIIFTSNKKFKIFKKEKYIIQTKLENGLWMISGNVRAFRDIIRNNLYETMSKHSKELCILIESFLYNNTFISDLHIFFIEFKEEFKFHFPDIDYAKDIYPYNIKIINDNQDGIDYYKQHYTLELIQHLPLTVKFVCDRGISHEIVRHRIASFSQESTRYCNYLKKGFRFIEPLWLNEKGKIARFIWKSMMWLSEFSYNRLLKLGWKAQEARSILPNSLKTEIVITATIKEWQSITKLRMDKAAHPQMIEIMKLLKNEIKGIYVRIFDD